MARLHIELEPRQGDFDTLLASRPGEHEPLTLCGRVTIRIDDQPFTFGTLRTDSYAERGGVPLVYVADFLECLLECGSRSLMSRRGEFSCAIVDRYHLLLKPTEAVVSLEILHETRMQRGGLRLRKRLSPVASVTIGKQEFAEALVSAAQPLLRTIAESRMDLLDQDAFWGKRIAGLLQDIRMWPLIPSGSR